MIMAKHMYLDLLKRTLTGMIYEDLPIPVPWLPHTDYQLQDRITGFDWPSHAPCMLGLTRLNNVQECVEQVLKDDIPGDLAECGVWRGGTTIFMRAVLKLYSITDRNVWVIDSFQGLPKDGEGYTSFGGAEHLAVPAREVQKNFELYDLNDSQVKFLPGWFKHTLPTAPIKKLSVLRLDGDLYESQRDVLINLYPKLSLGGYVIIDDPQMEGCGRAIKEYREERRIKEPMLEAGPWCVYWRKES
jgi:Macrocin-O-methyltransferase (TylF)